MDPNPFTRPGLAVDPVPAWTAAATAPATAAAENVESNGEGDGLRVELIEHDGIDVHDTSGELNLGGRIRWIRRVAVVTVLALASVVGARALIGRLASAELVVQTTAGSAHIVGDVTTVPLRRWTFPVPDGATVGMVTQDETTVYVLLRVAGVSGQQVSLLALERVTGATRWRYDITGVDGLVHATALGVLVNIFDGRSVTGSMLEPADGSVRWQLDGLVTPAPGSLDTAVVQQVSSRLAVGVRLVALGTGVDRWSPTGLLRTSIGLDIAIDASCTEISGRAISDGLVRWRYPASADANLCPRGPQPRVTVAADHVVLWDGTDFVGLDARGQEVWREPANGRNLVGANGAFVLVQSGTSVNDQAYIDPSTGDALDKATFDAVRGKNQDSTVLARLGNSTVMLVDQGTTVERLDSHTGQRKGAAMDGSGPIGLGRSSVYRISTDGRSLVGYELGSGRQRWSTSLDDTGGAGGAGGARVWSADRLIVAGPASGPLTAYG